MGQKPSPDYPQLKSERTASRTERHSSVDGCALLRLRFDRKHSLVQSQPLLHADQAEPPGPSLRLRCQNLRRGHSPRDEPHPAYPQAHFDVPCPTVFHFIAESLL
jgi:hypothetical protein